jgi:hypothetical protein
MFAGILGTWELLKNISQAVYINDRDRASAVTINVCNKTGTDGTVSIAVSSSATSVTSAEWIVFNADLLARQTFEKMGVLVPSGKYVVVKTSLDNCNAVVYGAVTGESITVAGITQNPGTAPTWVTSTTLPIFRAGDNTVTVQLEATDAESEPLSYSITSGSLPSALSLSSSGLITGTPDVAGYFSGIPDDTSTVTISATDSRTNSTARTFTVIKRWADGSSQSLAAASAQNIYDLSATFQGSSASGWYWIRGATSDTAQARRMYCSMNGAGYMMWYYYRDPQSGSLTITDPGTSGNTYSLTDNNNMFMFALPTAISNNVTYLYLNSDNDSSPTTPAFSQFKYAVQLNSELRTWLTTPKNAVNRWGVINIPQNSIRYTDVGAVNYRFGTVIGNMQYGHNHGGGDEVDGLSFRNLTGTGGLQWTTDGHIWDRSGWGIIDASSPTNVNTGWGSTGLDESAWGGANRQNRLYAWIK